MGHVEARPHRRHAEAIVVENSFEGGKSMLRDREMRTIDIKPL